MSDLGIDLHDETARSRLETAFWRLARDLLALGQSVVLESGFWSRFERDEKRSGGHALGAAVELHLLDVPFHERWERVRRRNERVVSGALITREQLAGMDRFFEPPHDEELRLFDLAVRH